MAVLIQHVSVLVVLALVSGAFRSTAAQGNTTRSSPTTQVVLLGTGTPGWDPDRSGPATAIVVNGTPYLIDFGPGVVRRAGAAYRKGVKALLPINLHVVFLTTGTWITRSILRSRSSAQQAGGGESCLWAMVERAQDMTEHILKAHTESRRYPVQGQRP
jgi:hypothetical protein